MAVVPGRLELPTSTLSVWRSNQLSYRTVQSCRIYDYDKQNRVQKAREGLPCTPYHTASLSECTRINVRRVIQGDSRKEVFQPHLPVRLPCYDLAPITSFTLGRPLRSQTSGAPGFHGLTGGVYKARERIHRAMADARLLASPRHG